MTNKDLLILQELTSMTECLLWALHATSAAQCQGSSDFCRLDRLQEAYIILHEVYLEAKEYEEDTGYRYTSCGACDGNGCDRCMPDLYLED